MSGATGSVLIDEVVDELVAGGVTLELRLLLNVGDGEDINELEFDLVELTDDEVSLELELEVTSVTNGVVTDTGTLGLRLLRELKDVGLTEVLVMGYRTLLEPILVLEVDTGLLLTPSEPLVVVLSTTLEGAFGLEEGQGLVDDRELAGVDAPADDLELVDVDGRKITVAKISP